MGFERSVWRILTGGGGGAGGGATGIPAVRCWLSQEEVSFSFKKSGERWWESTHLSTASLSSSNEHASLATPPDSCRRPASLISTLSSGSGSSRDETLAQGRSVQVELSPDEDDVNVAQGRGLIQRRNNNNNNAIKEATPTRGLRRQRLQRSSPVVVRSMAPSPQPTYLDRVVMELIETERTYVRDLRMIVEDHLAHIIDQCEQLSIRPEQVCALFGNIEDIYEFNSELLQDLDLCDNDPVAVARCFVLKSEYFEIYTQYCTNYPNSVAALTECMRNQTLARFFRERQASLKRSLPLGSYLLKPVQRILKYHLLLQEIAKHFDPQVAAGYEVVEEAIYTMTGVAWYINDMKRKHEHAVRLQEVQSLLLNWKGPDLTTYGELVLEGTFRVHRAKNQRTLFLFQRMLLITKRRGEHYVYKTHISCSTLMLIESAKDSLSFSVTHYKHPKQPHTVQAKTVEERKLWAHHIKRLILENHQAIIPQKAKDAILEMNPTYPPRYRYSPEQLKKTVSAQSDERRRRSEPSRQVVRSSKGVLRHSDSEGALPRPVPGGSSKLEEEEELCSRKFSLEELSFSEGEEQEEVLGLPGNEEQVEDFASSVLAAISCWHRRVAMVTEPEGGGIISNNGAKENGQPSEDNKPVEGDEQASADLLPLEVPPESPEPAEIPPQETCSNSKPPRSLESREESQEEAGQDGDPGLLEKPSPATPDSDSKTLSSSEESSEEEEEEEEEEQEEDMPNSAQRLSEASSILPSSVLDRAGAIAQHFSGSIKRGSLVQDASGAISPPTPQRLLSRTGSRLSLLGSEQRLSSVTSDPPVTPADQLDLSLLSPREDDLFDAPGRGLPRRRDSTLSQQDQLLLGKIKSYYEQAENQSPAFGLQRRESLTYIPSGLVRSSVTRLNSLPREESLLDGSSALSAQLKVSGDLLDPGPEEPSGEARPPRPHNPKDEEFRPSSEMIRIWQTMEQDLVRSSGQEPLPRASGMAQAEAETLSIQPLSESSGEGEAVALIKAPPSRVVHLKAEAEVEGSGVDAVDRTKSKVLNLARQYSQRIKTAKPLVRQRSQGLFTARKGLACVVEEKESTGKPRIQTGTQINMRTRTQSGTQPEAQTGVQTKTNTITQTQTQPTSLPLSPVEQTQKLPPQTPPSVRPRSCSPSSPFGWVSLEDFSWPDVQQLRSRYSELGRRQRSPVTRTRSIPDHVFSGGPRRHSSWSPDLLPLQDVLILPPQVDSGGGVEGRRLRLHRANSLDLRHSTAYIQELQDPTSMDHLNGYGVTAEAPLPNDPTHSVIVVEKLPGALLEKDQEGEDEEGYVQIRSPTSREKICLLAVVDRCRVYQESDQYKCRTEPRARPEHNAPQSQDDALQGQGSQQNLVKNLRAKFQSMN